MFRASAIFALASAPLVAAQDYPHCAEQNIVLRHAGAHAVFVDASMYGTAGCWQNDCKNTDKFNAEDKGVCARACAGISDCTHWTFGEQEGATKCFMRKSDGGREESQGWHAAPKSCTPAPVGDAFVAFTAASIPEMLACDGGKSDQCPDMAKAINTWKFAIAHLKKAANGVLDPNTYQYVTQVESDTNAFAAQMSEENFPVVAGNNRQVFQALHGWMDGQPKANLDQNDNSLPNPLRGSLCGPNHCYEKM